MACTMTTGPAHPCCCGNSRPPTAWGPPTGAGTASNAPSRTAPCAVSWRRWASRPGTRTRWNGPWLRPAWHRGGACCRRSPSPGKGRSSLSTSMCRTEAPSASGSSPKTATGYEADAAGQLGRAGRRRRRPHRPGDLRGPGPGAPRVAHPAGGQRGHGGPMPAHRHTGEAPHHRGARRAAELGPDRAALFRAVLPVLGHRRLLRPRRSRRHDRAGGRRLPAGQPAARRRAPAARRGLALPAHDTALLQPALPPGGGDPRIRLPGPGRPGRGGAAGRSTARREPLHRAAGPELQLRGQTGCPGAAVRRPARPRPLARVR